MFCVSGLQNINVNLTDNVLAEYYLYLLFVFYNMLVIIYNIM